MIIQRENGCQTSPKKSVSKSGDGREAIRIPRPSVDAFPDPHRHSQLEHPIVCTCYRIPY